MKYKNNSNMKSKILLTIALAIINTTQAHNTDCAIERQLLQYDLNNKCNVSHDVIQDIIANRPYGEDLYPNTYKYSPNITQNERVALYQERMNEIESNLEQYFTDQLDQLCE